MNSSSVHPIISNGHIFLPSIDALYCIGKADAPKTTTKAGKFAAETSLDKDKVVAQIMLTPVESMLASGQTIQLQVRGYNKNGQFVQVVKDAEVTAGRWRQGFKELRLYGPNCGCGCRCVDGQRPVK